MNNLLGVILDAGLLVLSNLLGEMVMMLSEALPGTGPFLDTGRQGLRPARRNFWAFGGSREAAVFGRIRSERGRCRVA
ncbi:hypothetical protein BD414DRAFT_473119 [Trametes punicea]|nr:hypothetical protein BD414DRAFT_473119 [Trametes punicea]